MLHLVCLSYFDLFQFLPEYKTDLIVVAISPVRSLLHISSNYIALNLDVFPYLSTLHVWTMTQMPR